VPQEKPVPDKMQVFIYIFSFASICGERKRGHQPNRRSLMPKSDLPAEAPSVTIAARAEPKKEPKQRRSRDTVERILAAAREIIECEGIEVVTTNHIATAASLSVASVYQFFPNKRAIVGELYRRWLADVDARVDAVIKTHQGGDWRALAGAIADQLGAVHMSSHTEMQLNRAMWSHRELLDLDRARGKQLAAKIVDSLRPHTEAFERHRCELLVGLAIESFTMVAYLDAENDASDREELNQAAKQIFFTMWERALAFSSGESEKDQISGAAPLFVQPSPT
jgi:AcrR family transcriptional regulator